jgi:phage gpG-like protein
MKPVLGVFQSGAWSRQPGQRVTRSIKVLQRSGRVAASIVQTYDAESALVGTNLVHAAIQTLDDQTKPRAIMAKNARALHLGGIFAKKVNHPASKIPARTFKRMRVRRKKPESTPEDFAQALERSGLPATAQRISEAAELI